jgi:hypothetical protein
MGTQKLLMVGLLLVFGSGGTSVPTGFAGHWFGTFSNPGFGASGTLDMQVQPGGDVVGEV